MSKANEASRTQGNSSNTFSSTRYLQPDFSEDPIIRSLNSPSGHLSDRKPFHSPSEFHSPAELNISTMPCSTQQSISVKRSFFFSSPKNSNQPEAFFPLKTEILTQSNIVDADALLPYYKLDEIRDSEPVEAEELRRRTVMTVDDNIVYEGNEDMRIPQLKWCAYCKAEVVTKIEYVNNSKTFWSSVAIFMSGGFLGCFLLPYMMDNCKGIKVLCHNCDRVLL